MNHTDRRRDRRNAPDTHPSQGCTSAPSESHDSLQAAIRSQSLINYSTNPSAYNSAAHNSKVEPPYATLASFPDGSKEQLFYPTMPMDIPWKGTPSHFASPPISASPYQQQTPATFGLSSQLGTAWPQNSQQLPRTKGSWKPTGPKTPLVNQPAASASSSDSASEQSDLSAQQYPTNMGSSLPAQDNVEQQEADTMRAQCCGFACCTCLAKCCCFLFASCCSQPCKRE